MSVSSDADRHLGSELAGYRIEELAGRGGMSVVYRAHDLALERNVALKLLAAELAEDRRFRDRFLRESRLAASIDHPNVIPIYDTGEVEGQLYIAMRYVEGTDLKQLLRVDGSLEPGRALAVLSQVAEGLDAAHARDLVHRDVKPSNVLISSQQEREHCYLADFGLTTSASSPDTPSEAQLTGTVDYLAPEQLTDGRSEAPGDIYALGCLLYEALTGQVPYPRESEFETLWAHVDEPPPRASEVDPDLPVEIDEVIAVAMAKDPAERYDSGRELVEAARAVFPEKAGRFRTRTIVLASLLITLLIAAAAIVPAVLLTGSTGDSVAPTLDVAQASIQRIDPETNELVATVALAGEEAPDPLQVPISCCGLMTVTDGAVWVLNRTAKTVIRVDTETNVVTEVSAGGTPIGVGSGLGSAWIAGGSPAGRVQTGETATLAELDADTGVVVRAIPVPIEPVFDFGIAEDNPLGGAVLGGVAVDDSASAPPQGLVWVASQQSSEVKRIDPFIRGVVDSINVGELVPLLVASGEGGIWVVQPGQLTRLDPQTGGIVAQVPLEFLPIRVAVGEGGVWLTDAVNDVVAMVDPETNDITRTISVGDMPAGVAVGSGSVWVANHRDESVSRIDPTTGQVVATIDVGSRPDEIGVGESGVWVTVHAESDPRSLSEEEYGAAVLKITRRTQALFRTAVGPLTFLLGTGDLDRVLSDYRPALNEQAIGFFEDEITDLEALAPPARFAGDHERYLQIERRQPDEVGALLRDALESGDGTALGQAIAAANEVDEALSRELSSEFQQFVSTLVDFASTDETEDEAFEVGTDGPAVDSTSSELTTENLIGNWRAVEPGSFLQLNEDRTYRIAFSAEDVENTTVDQGWFILERDRLLFISNEHSETCGAGQRLTDEIQVVDTGPSGPTRIKLIFVDDECSIRGSPGDVTLERLSQ